MHVSWELSVLSARKDSVAEPNASTADSRGARRPSRRPEAPKFTGALPTESLLRPVAAAVQNAEVLLPRSDGAAILMRQNPRDLVHVRHVMDGPGRQQFSERHR